MSAVREQLPEGRYGRSADQRADRRLKILGAVLGTGFLAMVGWFGYDYITEQKISAELIKFSVSSDREVQVHLEIRKDSGVTGSCTVRSRSEDGAEVGRLDVAVDRADETRIDQVVTVRTTARATSAELVQCAGE
ncbi:DUF4307 domain-containing protein [Streptomyces katsurahamanus]|uniref:DUF4307 domain-containing protein n=1 Tax=Streptomyces katsurahamanus TaxID=2577098 RepID=A0ABW9NMP3_9ACTN|nr:DUF4307 domain-containing protein [Streptomyces katsurahamanus]MQS34538.1 DUF4307 domain-containing protein [Streptomyces katsurahamanus]